MPEPQHLHDGTTTGVRCERIYAGSAGRFTKCGGPMTPIRRSEHWGCTWCGRVEVSH